MFSSSPLSCEVKYYFYDEICTLHVEIMWSEIVEYLKDATLVAKIQKCFGVKIHFSQTLKEHSKENLCSETHGTDSRIIKCNSNSYLLKSEELKENGYITTEKKTIRVAKTNVCTVDKQEKSPAVFNSDYTITNYFWYYLFLFGTKLGDEIFYSTFIPFWFWNIDGAVGRRVVLVWAIVMTTGMLLLHRDC